MQDVSSYRTAADRLNRDCFCVTLDKAALGLALQAQDAELAELMRERPHLLAHAPVFLPDADGAAMMAIVAAVEAAAANPRFAETVLAWAPPIAAPDFGPRGVFMGYDFHLGAEGPKLIEINTNAGGAFLNAFLARAQIACCAEVERALTLRSLTGFEARVTAMFEAEWSAQRPTGKPRRIAIVDDAPERQYLYPEFLLAKRLLEQSGFSVDIADPRALVYERGLLHFDGQPIDLVYNRLVDFGLDAPEHAALRQAYVDEAVVLTPNPHNHALFADKRNLIVLSDARALETINLEERHRGALASVPHAHRLNSANAKQLWDDRKGHFFKPASGHGGKAVYRGDKITRGVWADIVNRNYIAQELAPPSERLIELDGVRASRKLDVRLYTYRGELLLAAARLYQGQTTNFRTPGGGFAPVFFL